MRIGSIGGNEENPFLKSIEDLYSNPNEKIEHGIQPKTNEADVSKISGVKEGAGSNNANLSQHSLIDRSQFTNENDIQEIDLDEFVDDFK